MIYNDSNNIQEKLGELLEYSKKLSKCGMVVGAGGNTSVLINDTIYIKPSGLSFEEMVIGDWVEVDFETGDPKKHPKNHLPSSELQMHLDIYRGRSDVNCIFHAHPPFVIGVSAAGISFKHLFPDSVSYLGKEIPVVRYCEPCGTELATLVNKNIRNNLSIVLVNHGAITVGKEPKVTYLRIKILEELARMHWIASSSAQKSEYHVIPEDEVDKILNLKKIKYRQSLME